MKLSIAFVPAAERHGDGADAAHRAMRFLEVHACEYVDSAFPGMLRPRAVKEAVDVVFFKSKPDLLRR